MRARLARALRVTFGRSSEKLVDQLEQLELTLADLDERIAETEPKGSVEPIAAGACVECGSDSREVVDLVPTRRGGTPCCRLRADICGAANSAGDGQG